MNCIAKHLRKRPHSITFAPNAFDAQICSEQAAVSSSFIPLESLPPPTPPTTFPLPARSLTSYSDSIVALYWAPTQTTLVNVHEAYWRATDQSPLSHRRNVPLAPTTPHPAALLTKENLLILTSDVLAPIPRQPHASVPPLSPRNAYDLV